MFKYALFIVLFLFSCKKEDNPTILNDTPWWANAAALKNDKTWVCNNTVAYEIENNYVVIDFNMSDLYTKIPIETLGYYVPLEEKSFLNLQNFSLEKRGKEPMLGYLVSNSHGDLSVFGTVNEKDTINQISIEYINTQTRLIKGNFSASILMEKNNKIDTLRFTKGDFAVHY